MRIPHTPENEKRVGPSIFTNLMVGNRYRVPFSSYSSLLPADILKMISLRFDPENMMDNALQRDFAKAKSPWYNWAVVGNALLVTILVTFFYQGALHCAWDSSGSAEFGPQGKSLDCSFLRPSCISRI